MKAKTVLKTKLLLTLAIFISSLVAGTLLWPSSAIGSCRINDLSLEKEGNFTKLTIYADQPFVFVYSTEETKDGKPYRVIIDCKDAIHNLPQHNFGSVLPRGTIKAIRTSQFQTEPEKIVRIVLDLDKPAIYKIVENGEGKKGVIALSSPQESDFPFWSAAKNEKSLLEGRSVSSTPIEKTSKETSKDKDALLASPENKTQLEFKPSENAGAQKVERKVTSDRQLSFADTSETIVNQEISKDKEVGEKTSGQIKDKMILATSLTSPDILLTPNEKNKKLPAEQEEQKKTGTKVEGEATSSKAMPHAVPAGNEAEKVVSAPAEERKTEFLNPTTQEKRLALLSSQEKPIRGEMASPESLVIAPRPEGSQLQLVPEREVIYYHDEGRRDPFAPLTERIITDFGKIPLPSFESLKLVGVLRDEEGNRALLEDEKGYGYILKGGDKIKNGYVISVEDNKVIFQIQEYGWSRTIALELSNEY